MMQGNVVSSGRRERIRKFAVAALPFCFLLAARLLLRHTLSSLPFGIAFPALLLVVLVAIASARIALSGGIYRTTDIAGAVASAFVGAYMIAPPEMRRLVRQSGSWRTVFLSALFIVASGAAWKAVGVFRMTSGSLQERLSQAASSLVSPTIRRLLAVEVGILYSAFFSWGRGRQAPNRRLFSCYRNGSDYITMWLLAAMSVPEIAAVHIVVAHWSRATAWVLTDLGAIGAVYMVGLAKSFLTHQTEVTDEKLIGRLGLLKELSVPLDRVLSVEAIGGRPPGQSQHVRLWFLDEPNISVVFSDASGQTIVADLRLDEPECFLRTMAVAS